MKENSYMMYAEDVSQELGISKGYVQISPDRCEYFA